MNSNTQNESSLSHSSTDPWSDERYFEFEKNLRLTILMLGLVGNFFMFVVYYQSNLSKLSVAIYFRALAFFCACQSIQNFITLFLEEDAHVDSSLIVCKIIGYLSTMLTPLAAWFEMAAGLDRFFSIVYPTRFKIWLCKIFHQVSVSTIIIYNMIFYSHLLFDYQLFMDYYLMPNGSDTISFCRVADDNPIKYTDFENGVALPITFMVISSIATFVGVLQAHKRVKFAISRKDRLLARDLKFGITMIVLNVLFVLFNVPYRLYFSKILGWDLYTTDLFDDLLAQNVFITVVTVLFHCYFSINFYVQLIVNSLIRRELVNLFGRIFKLLRSLNVSRFSTEDFRVSN